MDTIAELRQRAGAVETQRRTTEGSRGDAENAENGDGKANHEGHEEHEGRPLNSAVPVLPCPVCGLRILGRLTLLTGQTMHVHGQRIHLDGDTVIFGCVEPQA